MRTLLVSALALGAFTSAAFAEPLVLSDVQLDALTAGQNEVSQTNTSTVTVTQSNASTIEGEDNTVTQSNASDVMVSQNNSSSIAPPPAD